MAFVPATNVARFAVEQTAVGEKIVNVLWISDPAGWTANKLGTACQTIAAAWDTHLKSVLSTTWTLDKVVAQDYSTYNGISTEYTPVSQIQGTGSGDALPPQVALVVSWRTNMRGRSFRGRTYLGGFTEFYQASGRLSSPVLTPVTNWGNELLTTFHGFSEYPGVVSYFTNSQPRMTGLFTAFEAFRCNGILYTQRRRTVQAD